MKQHELFRSIYESNLKSRAVNVMSCLITYMNAKDNTCFPSLKTIAKCCSISVNTVKRALDDLVTAGFVEKEARFIEAKNGAQTSNLYRLSAVLTAPDLSTDQNNRTKEDKLVLETNDKEYEVVSFEDLKEESDTATHSQVQIDNNSVVTTPEKRSAAVDNVEKAILEIKRSVNVISANIKISIPSVQLLYVPP